MFGDMLERMPRQYNEDLDRMMSRAHALYDQYFETAGPAAAKQHVHDYILCAAPKLVHFHKVQLSIDAESYCFRHKKKCPVFPRRLKRAKRLNIAGIECQPWSQQGPRKGFLGFQKKKKTQQQNKKKTHKQDTNKKQKKKKVFSASSSRP